MFHKKLIMLQVYKPTQTDRPVAFTKSYSSFATYYSSLDRKFSEDIPIFFAGVRKMCLVSPRQVIALFLLRGGRKTCEWCFVFPTECAS